MKVIKLFIIGMLLCLCCSAVVCAAETNAVPAARPTDVIPAAADAGRENPIVTSQPGYTQWDIYWTTSALIIPDGYSALYDTNYVYHGQGSTSIGVIAGHTAWILIPFTNTITHSGAHPYTRWVYVQMATDNSYGSSTFYATGLMAYDGPDYVATFTPSIPWMNGYMWTYYCDLGSYHEYDRGLQCTLKMYNPDTVTHYLYITGAGAKAEW